MNPFSILLNLVWLIFGGLHAAICWFLASLIFAVTIVGIPWARAAFNIGVLALLPFGARATSRIQVNRRPDIGTGPLGWLGNILWIVFAGWWLFLIHLAYALALAITIIGIPFAFQHWKLAKLCFSPIGKTIVWD